LYPATHTKAQVGVSVNGQRAGVLIVDDERDLLDLLAFLVEQAGLVPLVAPEPVEALEIFDKEHPSVAVVDLNLQPWDGFELLRELRRRSANVPILVLTARASEDDKVRALDMGADDYVVKPFGHRELVARIRAHARRSELEPGASAATVLEVGALRLDLTERTLQLDGESLRLTGTEFRLLEYLMRHGDSVVPTAALAKHVWGYDDAPARDVVRVTVHRLRRKLKDDDSDRRLIHTVPGVGLKLRPSAISQGSPRPA
jgi:DNA-binding response OmpR family regulator